MSGLRLARMRDADLDEVLSIERGSFRTPWRREHFLHELHHNPHGFNRVARAGDELAAYASCWLLPPELTINNIAVRQDRRGRGVGRWLLQRLLDEALAAGCKRALLDVRPSNRPARALYRGLGFREVGRRPGYYHAEKEDAILMERTLQAD